MHLMLAQCSDTLGVRAVARYKEADFRPDLASLSGKGSLTVTVENEDLSQRYQGIVPLTGERLSDCLRSYFETSEQLPTRLWLHADEHGASGLLLQRLSDDSVKSRTPGSRAHEMNQAEIDDAWNRVQMLGDTLKPEELQTLSDRNILRRLFAEDDVRLFESAPVFFKCRCSRERVVGMLKALGPEEVKSVLAEQGHVEVRCDFCNRAYRFDSVDVEQLFAGAATPTTDAPDRRH
jgi:molecular chaperone Hsp33